MNTIKRDVYVLRDTIKIPIEITQGTNMVGIEFTLRDYNIPVTAAAVVYAYNPTMEKPHSQMCVVTDNVISFTPEKNFFAIGTNELQIRIISGDNALISFKEKVKCFDSEEFHDEDEEGQQTLVEKIMSYVGTEIGTTKKAVENEISDRKSADTKEAEAREAADTKEKEDRISAIKEEKKGRDEADKELQTALENNKEKINVLCGRNVESGRALKLYGASGSLVYGCWGEGLYYYGGYYGNGAPSDWAGIMFVAIVRDSNGDANTFIKTAITAECKIYVMRQAANGSVEQNWKEI